MSLPKTLTSPWISLLGGLVVAAAAGCATSSDAAPSGAANAGSAPAAQPASAPPTSFADQVTEGGKVYGAQCANCHGASGQGTPKGPRVVGLKEGALPLDPPADRKFRKGKFVTVADVAEFVVANMPPGKGGSLPADQYWAILAFDLHANGVDLPQPLTPELAKTLTIPR